MGSELSRGMRSMDTAIVFRPAGICRDRHVRRRCGGLDSQICLDFDSHICLIRPEGGNVLFFLRSLRISLGRPIKVLAQERDGLVPMLFARFSSAIISYHFMFFQIIMEVMVFDWLLMVNQIESRILHELSWMFM